VEDQVPNLHPIPGVGERHTALPHDTGLCWQHPIPFTEDIEHLRGRGLGEKEERNTVVYKRNMWCTKCVAVMKEKNHSPERQTS